MAWHMSHTPMHIPTQYPLADHTLVHTEKYICALLILLPQGTAVSLSVSSETTDLNTGY